MSLRTSSAAMSIPKASAPVAILSIARVARNREAPMRRATIHYTPNITGNSSAVAASGPSCGSSHRVRNTPSAKPAEKTAPK